MPLIVSHMFVFYFGIMADLTPPVALAAFAAAPIARASAHEDRLRGDADRHSPASSCPFMAVYAPALMLQDGGPWPGHRLPLLSPTSSSRRVLAIGLWGAAAIGYLARPAAPGPSGSSATAAAFLLVVALPVTDEIGFALAAVFLGLALVARARRAGPGVMAFCLLAGGAVAALAVSASPSPGPTRSSASRWKRTGRSAPARSSWSRRGSRAAVPAWSPAPAPTLHDGW